MQDLMATIVSLFSSIQKIPQDQVDPQADIFQEYGVNSIRAVKLLSTLEVELDIEFPEEDMQEIRTLEDVRDLAQKLLSQQPEELATGN